VPVKGVQRGVGNDEIVGILRTEALSPTAEGRFRQPERIPFGVRKLESLWPTSISDSALDAVLGLLVGPILVVGNR
jgi:hypothetical protein